MVSPRRAERALANPQRVWGDATTGFGARAHGQDESWVVGSVATAAERGAGPLSRGVSGEAGERLRGQGDGEEDEFGIREGRERGMGYGGGQVGGRNWDRY